MKRGYIRRWPVHPPFLEHQRVVVYEIHGTDAIGRKVAQAPHRPVQAVAKGVQHRRYGAVRVVWVVHRVKLHSAICKGVDANGLQILPIVKLGHIVVQVVLQLDVKVCHSARNHRFCATERKRSLIVVCIHICCHMLTASATSCTCVGKLGCNDISWLEPSYVNALACRSLSPYDCS